MQNPLEKFLLNLAEKIQTEKEYKEIVSNSQSVDVNKDVFAGFVEGIAKTIRENVKVPVLSAGNEQPSQPDPLDKFLGTLKDKLKEAPVKKPEIRVVPISAAPVVNEQPPKQEKDAFEGFVTNLADIIKKEKTKPAKKKIIATTDEDNEENKTQSPAEPVDDYVKILSTEKKKDKEEEEDDEEDDALKSFVSSYVNKELANFQKEMAEKMDELKDAVEREMMDDGAGDGGGGGTNSYDYYPAGGPMNGNLLFPVSGTGIIFADGQLLSSYPTGGGGDPAVNTVVYSNSANWNSTYTTVNTYSGTWSTGIQTLTFDNNNYDLSISSGNTVSLSSLKDNLSEIISTSSSWNSSYTTTNNNSAGWNSNYTTTNNNSAGWNSNYTTTNNNSAGWSSVYTTTNNNSAGWSSVYTNVNNNSATWNNAIYAVNGTANQISAVTTGTGQADKTVTLSLPSELIVPNNLTVQGNLTALGSSTFKNTIFTTTSALSVVNTGPGPALYVFQSAGPSDVASFYDGDGVEVLHVGNANFGQGGKIGINESYPTVIGLTVNGQISANNTITAPGGNSNQWNSTYTTVNSNSANYILDGGNTKGADIVIGTNDNFNFTIESNSIRRLLFTNSGIISAGSNPSTSFNSGSATGNISFAVGSGRAFGQRSFAQGNNSLASGSNSYAEGSNTSASGSSSHAEGTSTQASNTNSHAEGSGSIASGQQSHAEGTNTTASGTASHSEGQSTQASGNRSHSEGTSTVAGPGINSHAEGDGTTASGNRSHTEGLTTVASGDSSHAEGQLTTASGTNSHTEGRSTIASGTQTHAEGLRCVAGPGGNSHAEGRDCFAIGDGSHAEGNNTRAVGINAHSEGSDNYADGNYSHAAGRYAATAFNNTWIWHGDSTATQQISTTRADQFLVSAAGGMFIPGNVGIGTDNNSNALTVNGQISANNSLFVGDSVFSVQPGATYPVTISRATNPFLVFNMGGGSTFSGFRFQINNIDRYTAALNSGGDQIYSRFTAGGAYAGDTLSLGSNGDVTMNTSQFKLINSTGNVGIGTALPQAKLTVSGQVSANNIITALDGNSNQWNSTYTTVSSNSANWSGVYTTTNTNSAKYDSAYTTTNTNSANWQSTSLAFAVSDEQANLTTGNAKITFTIPYSFKLTKIKGGLNSAATGSSVVFSLSSLTNSNTAGTVTIPEGSVVADSAALSYDMIENDRMCINVTQVGSTTPGVGLKAYLIGTYL